MGDFFASAYRRLNERIADARAGMPVWWSRSGFSTAAYRDVTPKKHVLIGRARDTRVDEDGELLTGDKHAYIYTALCGYRYSRSETIYGPIVPTKSMPPATDRCRKCMKVLAELKADGKTVADTINPRPGVSKDPEE